MTVFDTISARAMPGKVMAALTDNTHLAPLGIDSLGLVLVFVDLTSRTGLQFERQEGMADIRTIGDVVQYALQLSRHENTEMN